MPDWIQRRDWGRRMTREPEGQTTSPSPETLSQTWRAAARMGWLHEVRLEEGLARCQWREGSGAAREGIGCMGAARVREVAEIGIETHSHKAGKWGNQGGGEGVGGWEWWWGVGEWWWVVVRGELGVGEGMGAAAGAGGGG